MNMERLKYIVIIGAVLIFMGIGTLAIALVMKLSSDNDSSNKKMDNITIHLDKHDSMYRFDIEKNKAFMHVINQKTGIEKIIIFNVKNGKKIQEIELSRPDETND